MKVLVAGSFRPAKFALVLLWASGLLVVASVTASRADEVGPSGAKASSGAEKRFAAQKNKRIAVGGSQFGRMLFDRAGQAIYVFENDRRGRSRCYGPCARGWPPVLTKGRPKAIDGARQRLLGTTRRKGGAMQVTYAGRPLYFYAHELPGQVFCHNVFLNGGMWWVLRPGGSPAP